MFLTLFLTFPFGKNNLPLESCNGQNSEKPHLKRNWSPNPKLRLREQVREVMRFHHYSIRTEESYWQWIKRFIFFHDKRHPKDTGEPEKFKLRKTLAEHPFGTIKRWFGYTHFLLKGLAKVQCEWSLIPQTRDWPTTSNGC